MNEGLIQMYIDGEASKEQVKEIESHLMSCSLCVDKIEEQRGVARNIKKAINLLPDDELNKPLSEKWPIKSKKKFSIRRMPFIEIAASIFLIAVFVFSYRQKSEEPIPSVYYQLDWEADANLPITDQEFVIKVWETHGKESESMIQ